jgi:hypothetical protein
MILPPQKTDLDSLAATDPAAAREKLKESVATLAGGSKANNATLKKFNAALKTIVGQ